MKKNYFFTFLLTLLISSLSFGQIVITEIADPNNDAGARFVELYNISDASIDMTSWSLRRYTNGGTDLSTNVVDLTPLGNLPAGGFAIIAANATNFETVYGMAADIDAGTGGPADSNGDDQIVVYNSTDEVVDIFGVPGEDGTGTCHEFEDGRAERKSSVTASNATWNDSEWNVWADSTVSGCTTHTNSPRTAPQDFDPKSWIGATTTTEPSITITSPTESTVYTTSNVDVTFSIANFTLSADNGSDASDSSGDGYIIASAQLQGDPDENFNVFTTTVPAIEVVPGNTYIVKMELVDNSGMSLSPAVSQSVTFSADFECQLSLGEIITNCDAITTGSDAFSGSIAFTGGNTAATYTITAPAGVTVGGDNPDTVESGTITFSGMTEGTDAEVTIAGTTNSSCNLTTTLISPVCRPLPISEDFTYPDGSLTDNPLWVSNGGTTGDLMVISGQVLVQHGTPSEDASLGFTPVTGNIYYAFDFTVVDPGSPISGTDNEYFAHFKDSGFGFRGRLDIVPPSTTGDFSVGISTIGSTADATWASDLSFGTSYRVTVKYDQDNNIAQLWINASVESDTSILGTDETAPGNSMVAFGLRQSDSDLNEGILVDNLRIATTFAATTLSIVREISIQGFTAYPNPVTNNRFTLTTNSSLKKEITIFNVIGKQVLSTSFSGLKSDIDVSTISSGLYILKVTEGNKTATSKLVIK